MALPLMTLSRRAALGLAMMLWAPAPAWAQEGLAGLNGPPPAQAYLSAEGSFALKVPQSWAIKEEKAHKDRILLRSLMAPDAFVEMRRIPVSPGARPKQLALIAKDVRLGKMPHFRQLLVREMPVGGIPAASIMGTYWYQGNAEYPRLVEEIFLVGQTEGYVFHFECFEPLAQALAPEVNAIYSSFVPHPAPMGPTPAAPQEEGDVWDKLPF